MKNFRKKMSPAGWISFALFLVFLALTAVNIYNRTGGSLGDRDENLKALESYMNGYNEKPLGAADLKKPASFAVIEKTNHGFELVYQSNHSLNKKNWVPKDIKGFDYIVIVTYDMDSAAYKSNDSKKTVTMKSERANLTYYDVAIRQVVAYYSISHDLPSSTTTVRNYWVGMDQIIGSICSRLGGSYPSTLFFWFCIAMALVFFFVMLIVNKKYREKVSEADAAEVAARLAAEMAAEKEAEKAAKAKKPTEEDPAR